MEDAASKPAVPSATMATPPTQGARGKSDATSAPPKTEEIKLATKPTRQVGGDHGRGGRAYGGRVVIRITVEGWSVPRVYRHPVYSVVVGVSKQPHSCES